MCTDHAEKGSATSRTELLALGLPPSKGRDCRAAGFLAERELKERALAAVLDDYKARQLTPYAIYPPARHLAVKVRLFIDFLVERMR